MVEPRSEPGLAQEALHDDVAAPELAVQDLDDRLAPERRLVAAVHRAEPALADPLAEDELANLSPGEVVLVRHPRPDGNIAGSEGCAWSTEKQHAAKRCRMTRVSGYMPAPTGIRAVLSEELPVTCCRHGRVLPDRGDPPRPSPRPVWRGGGAVSRPRGGQPSEPAAEPAMVPGSRPGRRSHLRCAGAFVRLSSTKLCIDLGDASGAAFPGSRPGERWRRATPRGYTCLRETTDY